MQLDPSLRGSVMIKTTVVEGKGRGVVATANIIPGMLITTDPLFLPDTCSLGFECFPYDDDYDCLPLGLISLCNHSYEPNAYLVLDDRSDEMKLYAARDIMPGQEVTIAYNYKLNFTPKE